MESKAECRVLLKGGRGEGFKGRKKRDTVKRWGVGGKKTTRELNTDNQRQVTRSLWHSCFSRKIARQDRKQELGWEVLWIGSSIFIDRWRKKEAMMTEMSPNAGTKKREYDLRSSEPRGLEPV